MSNRPGGGRTARAAACSAFCFSFDLAADSLFLILRRRSFGSMSSGGSGAFLRPPFLLAGSGSGSSRLGPAGYYRIHQAHFGLRLTASATVHQRCRQLPLRLARGRVLTGGQK